MAEPEHPPVRFRIRPLEGYTVLELGCYLAGPLACRHLQQLGARVIAVVRPASARGASEERAWRPEVAAALLEGKQAVELDLRTAAGARAARLLVQRHADLVVENFRPGVAARLGLDAEGCRRLRPDVVHLSLPGFASTDAALRELPARESLLMARGGVLDAGVDRRLMGARASYSQLPLASAYGSALGALAACAALLRRARGGPGEAIEVPLAAALLDVLAHNSVELPLPQHYLSRRQRSLAERPDAEPLDYEELQELMDPFFADYRCADGRPFLLAAFAHLQHQRRALAALGLEREVEALGVPVAKPYASGEPEHGLGAGQVGDRWAAPLRRLLRRRFLTRPALEWEALLGAAGVPCAAHRTTAEWLRSAHARDFFASETV